MFTNPGTWRQRPGAHRATRATLATLATGALLLGACGDDDDANATVGSTATTTTTTTTPTTTSEPREEPAQDDAKALPQGSSEVSAGERVEASELGGLRFTVPEDRTVYQAPGLLSLEGRPAGINLVSVVETLDGDPIDSVETVVSLIDEATVTLDEADSTTIAGHEARVFDFTAAPERLPRPQYAVFRFEQGGVGGWGPVGEGRVWLLDTPRGILLFDAGVVEPGPTDVADGIAEAEAIFDTLEFVEVRS